MPIYRLCMEYTGLLYSSKFVKTEVYRFLIHMAAFGASTSKPSYLYSNHTCFKDCRVSRCSPKASNRYHNPNQIPMPSLLLLLLQFVYCASSSQELSKLSETRAKNGWNKVKKTIVKRVRDEVWQQI